MATALVNLAVPLAEAAKGLIEEFHSSPEQKADQLAKIAAAQAQVEQAANDYNAKLNDIAGQNIRADDATGDKFTQHARPWFMYLVELVMAFNYIVIPTIQAATGKALAPMVLPTDLLTLFGVCITGYVFNRTAEKISALPGDSQINVLGVKVGNKS